MGPITLFDKSFLEMLNVDEASVFDALYSTVICPIFYTEVLADLSKEPRDERTAERLVVDVAKKTPIMHSTPHVLHSTICLRELAGHMVDMRQEPVRAGGRPARNSEGEVGIIYDEAPEAKTFDRWQSGRFQEIERDFGEGQGFLGLRTAFALLGATLKVAGGSSAVDRYGGTAADGVCSIHGALPPRRRVLSRRRR